MAVVFVRGVTSDERNSWPELASLAALDAASNFESFSNFCAAFEFLLGRFLGFVIRFISDYRRFFQIFGSRL